jgi:hypothetical protein
MPKFLIHETIIREYEVDAADLWEAHEKAMNLDECNNYTEHSEGVTYIREVNGATDLIL